MQSLVLASLGFNRLGSCGCHLVKLNDVFEWSQTYEPSTIKSLAPVQDVQLKNSSGPQVTKRQMKKKYSELYLHLKLIKNIQIFIRETVFRFTFKIKML